MNTVYEFKATGSKHQIYPWFKAINALVDETRLTITDEGIDIICVDPANVAMATAHISPEQFETFKTTANAEDPLILGMDLQRYTNIMSKRHIRNKSTFSFKALPPLEKLPELPDVTPTKHYDYVDSKYLYRILFGIDTIFFKYNTLGPTTITKKPKLPRFNLPIEFKISINELLDVVCAMETATIDHIRYIVDFTDKNNPIFTMFGETGDAEPVYRSIPTSDLPYFKCTAVNSHIDSNHRISSFHSVNYLGDIFKALKAFGGPGEVKINLGQDFPMQFTMELENKSNLMYMLAPRIESE